MPAETDRPLAMVHERVLRNVSAQRERAEAGLACHLQRGGQRSAVPRQERLVVELLQAERRHREIVARLEAVGA